MGATHHLHPNVRFLQLQSSDEKSTVRSDRKSLIKLKAHLRVCLFLHVRLPIRPGDLGKVGCELTEERSDAWEPHITFIRT